MTSTRVGVVGCGGISRAHTNVYKTIEGVQIAWVYDVNAEAAAALAAEAGAKAAGSVEQMADRKQLDAVSVCTPPGLHLDHALPFLRAGVAVLCEKPMEVSVERAERLAAAARQAAVPFMVAYCHRFHPAIVEMKKLAASGELGEPMFFRNSFGGAIDLKGNSRANPALSGGGSLIDNGSHSIDLFRFLVGNPRRVQAMAGKIMQDLPIEDFHAIHLSAGEAGGRPYGELVSTYSLEHLPSSVEWHGTKGAAIASYWNPGVPDLRYRLAGEKDWTPIDCSALPDRFTAELRHFVECARTGKPPAITADDGVATARVVEAAYRSVRDGAAVAL